MNVNSASIPARRVEDDKDDCAMPLSAPTRATFIPHSKTPRGAEPIQNSVGHDTQPFTVADATSQRVNLPLANSTRRDQSPATDVFDSRLGKHVPDHNSRAVPSAQRLQHPPLSGNSQDTSSTKDADLVFTPRSSEEAMSPIDSAQDSSQDSQLLRLSQIAAEQSRIPDGSTEACEDGVSSRKRMADGTAKHTRAKSSASPVRMGGHSRNTSTVSVASTAGSRIGELSAELKSRLSYAMLKVSNGWQSHSIDQVETLASQAASPTSSNSTIHLRNGSSASPQLSSASHRGSNNTTPATGPSQQFPPRLNESTWRDTVHPGSAGSPVSPVKAAHTLAPPISIQPSRHLNHPRRNSTPKLTPSFLSGSHASPVAGPRTPGQPSPYLGNGHQQRTPLVDPYLFTPNQNVREKDAIESLLFMSSPGNSANLKHTFPSSSQPPPSAHGGTQRTALPTSQPRKSLPSGRPIHHARSQSHTQKRVGFEKSPGEMDIDEPFGTPHSRGTPRRKVNGSGAYSHGETQAPAVRTKHLPVSSGLTVPTRPRPALGDEEIDRMLAQATADDSDSDGEIPIPLSRARRDGARLLGT